MTFLFEEESKRDVDDQNQGQGSNRLLDLKYYYDERDDEKDYSGHHGNYDDDHSFGPAISLPEPGTGFRGKGKRPSYPFDTERESQSYV